MRTARLDRMELSPQSTNRLQADQLAEKVGGAIGLERREFILNSSLREPTLSPNRLLSQPWDCGTLRKVDPPPASP